MRNSRAHLLRAVLRPLLPGVGVLVAGSASAQLVNQSHLLPTGPGISSQSVDVDFADVDSDGDWDAAFADGGDSTNDQNRLWINQGGAQAGWLGLFADVTLSQMPQSSDDSYDLDFGDIDGDSDVDMYVSNNSELSNQGNRWLVNQGGLQGGAPGFFVDETGARWIGLGQAGSSIAPSLLLPDTFIAWSADSDFADFDNDGDLDLMHSSLGGFGGTTPTRVFLNDGGGFFEEFNPSGFQLLGSNIEPGDPGLWAEGTHRPNTLDATGVECDVASTTLDVELTDIDGDLDIDVVHGALSQLPRVFRNRLEENGGSQLAFRDVTSAVFPPGYATSNFNYEQELGDLDHDGDVDLLGVNWSGFDEVTFLNDGSGAFAPGVLLANSGADDNEGDFFDYDNDGDLDLYVANFSGPDKVYRNQLIETGSFSYTTTDDVVPAFPGISLDGEACDVDADGDYDVMVALDNNAPNVYLENTSNVADTSAPRLYRLEGLASAAASSARRPVRVQVYDNAPYYVTATNATHLEVQVDGIALPDFPMVSSGGQIFRGELPGNLVGAVTYRAVSADEYANSGTTPFAAYLGTGPTGTYAGSASESAAGGSLTLRSLAAPIAAAPLYLAGENALPQAVGFFAFSLSTLPGLDLGGGLIVNLGLPLLGDLIPASCDADGRALLAIQAAPPALAGTTLHAQFAALGGAAGSAFASSQRLELNF